MESGTNGMTDTPKELTLDQIIAHFGTDDAARAYL
jgi:hypothetical protein